MKAARTALLGVFCLLLPGCYSLACCGLDKRLTAPDRTTVVAVVVWEREPGLADVGSPVQGTLLSIVTYPLDILASSVFAVAAAFDSRLDVRWGLLGAVGAITLPGLTLVPSRFKRLDAREVAIEPQAFDALLLAIRNGRPHSELARIQELWNRRVVAVEVVDVTEVTEEKALESGPK